MTRPLCQRCGDPVIGSWVRDVDGYVVHSECLRLRLRPHGAYVWVTVVICASFLALILHWLLRVLS